MKFSLAAALGAAALGLFAAGAGAQAPLVPSRAFHWHPMGVFGTPPPNVRSVHSYGHSYNSAPRPGAASGLISARAFAASIFSAGLDPWTDAGPSPVHNGGGAFGGPNIADGYDGGINQDVSGRMVAIAADPTDPLTYYVGAAGGGVWKTTDGGKSYLPLTDFLGNTAMGSITIAPSNHNIIYAGTGEPNFAGDSRYGIGLLKSTNGGATWSVIPGPKTASSPGGVFFRKAISRIVVDPTNPDVVYLGTVLGALNGNGFADGGVWKTTDGGVNWVNTTNSATAFVNSNALFSDVAMNSKNPNILYTAVGYPGTFAGNGVFKTTDGGVHWSQLTGGLPLPANAPVGGQTTLALSPSADGKSDTLYVSIPSTGTAAANFSDAYTLLGLYKSTDSGLTFTNLNAPDYLTGQGFYDNAIVVSQTNPDIIFAAGKVNYNDVYGFTNNPTDYTNLRTLIGSTDGGKTFTDFSLGEGYVGPHTDTHALTFTPDGKLLDGNDGGIWRLENPLIKNPAPPQSDTVNGSNIVWSDINGNLDTLQFTGIALDPSNAEVAYGGAQDNGTSKKLSSTYWTQVRGGDGGFTRVDHSSPQTVYHEYYGISLERSDDGGLTWNGATNGINPNDPSPNFNENGTLGGRTDPAAFYVPFKLDPLNQSHVVYGTDHVYLSTDKGDNFTPIGIPGTNGYNPNDATVDSIGVAGSTIYAEAATAIYATFDGGATWQDRSIPATLGADYLSDFDVNPGNPLDVLVVKSAFDDRSLGKVFRSTDGGLNWSDISGNLPNIPFNSVRVDHKSGTVYAAGDNGVYVSTNFGGSWARIPGSMPTVAVIDLDISSPTHLLGAGTHGRGLWTLPLSSVIATPNLKLNSAVKRLSSTSVSVTVTLSNFGTSTSAVGVGAGDALNTVLTLTLGGKTVAASKVGAVPAYGNSQAVTFVFTGVPAGYAGLRFAGTYSGGSFSGSQRVLVP